MESGKEAVQAAKPPSEKLISKEEQPPAPETIQPTPTVTIATPIQAFVEKLPEARSIRKTSTSPPPEWAMERVRAMLALSEPIPRIVERLVAKGLSAEDASSAVDVVLEERVRATMAPIRERERYSKLHRILSAGVAVLAAIVAFTSGDGYYASWVCIRMAIPLTCIWFVPSTSVKGFFVRWTAWLLLLALAARTVWWEYAFGN
jgi:hypothetical protein